MQIKSVLVPAVVGLGLLLADGTQSHASQSSNTLPEIAGHLSRGLNIEAWFQREDGRSLTSEQLRDLANYGFDHVRLPLEPRLLEVAREKTLIRLEQAIHDLNGVGLAVIIDMHASGEFGKFVSTEPENAMRAINRLWKELAEYLSSRTYPKMVAFELFNEPDMGESDWSTYLDNLIATVRDAAPRHTLLVGNVWKNHFRALLKMQLRQDRNLIYVIHYYDPMVFTHQGASWSSTKSLRSVPFPPPGKASVKLEDLSTDVDHGIQRKVGEYMSSSDELQRVERNFAEVTEWAKVNHVAVCMTEFGVIKLAPAEDRARWLRMVRTAAETQGIGWTMWDYASDFGLYDRDKDGTLKLNTEVIDALGLRAP